MYREMMIKGRKVVMNTKRKCCTYSMVLAWHIYFFPKKCRGHPFRLCGSHAVLWKPHDRRDSERSNGFVDSPRPSIAGPQDYQMNPENVRQPRSSSTLLLNKCSNDRKCTFGRANSAQIEPTLSGSLLRCSRKGYGTSDEQATSGAFCVTTFGHSPNTFTAQTHHSVRSCMVHVRFKSLALFVCKHLPSPQESSLTSRRSTTLLASHKLTLCSNNRPSLRVPLFLTLTRPDAPTHTCR